MIGYDSNRGGVSVVTEKGVESSSSLLIQNARPSDSGKYVCRPDNAEPATVNVHVLNGKIERRQLFLWFKRDFTIIERPFPNQP